MKNYRIVAYPELPRFCGGLVGYVGYDAVRFWEKIPDENPDSLGLPDMVFLLTETILVFDHVRHKIKLIANIPIEGEGRRACEAAYKLAVSKIEEMARRLQRPLRIKTAPLHRKGGVKLSSNLSQKEFGRAVGKAKEYIRNGDIIQVVLSQRFTVAFRGSTFEIYRHLRSLNPSPYMFYLQLKEVTLIGSSPEMLVRCVGRDVETRPIAGTRPRGKDDVEDRLLEKELLADQKERAEHLMLVDLGRNDLGRICESGSVTVPEFMTIERYSHVMHIVSSVQGRLLEGKDPYRLLEATFPAGTVAGSPKIRAMEIIDELENVRRGPYAGCVGYFSFSGNLDTCITIRTIVVKDGRAYIQAGAGIVADSQPQREYQETVNKARALLEALDVC
jgi:anthranilate synthase component 1